MLQKIGLPVKCGEVVDAVVGGLMKPFVTELSIAV